MKNGPTDLQRAEMRHRPEGRAVMHQDWGKLLFIHWRMDEDLLRPLVPEPLEIDTFDGSGWIAIAPFTMWGIRAFPPFLPPIPGLSSCHELNVRTYVYIDDIPGVWFFSLDCNSAAAVLGARSLFFLNYYNAEIDLQQNGNLIDYSLVRTDKPDAAFEARWKLGEMLKYSQPGSLEFFLTERYLLFSERDDEIYCARIHHQPWPLQEATLTSFNSSMIEAAGLPTPKGEPLVHYAEEVNVEVWPLEEVET
jgi:uncharacterized protein YqjF (DUF2071 family)